MGTERLTLKMITDGIRKNPIAVAITLVSACVGAFFGVLAYYNGWLG